MFISPNVVFHRETHVLLQPAEEADVAEYADYYIIPSPLQPADVNFLFSFGQEKKAVAMSNYLNKLLLVSCYLLLVVCDVGGLSASSTF
jgi:hypothetical protein